MERDCIHTGDAFDVLPDLPAESVHACVTDPPYGLAFMGRDWDDFEPKEYQEWCEEWAREVRRVLKPGAHLLAFSGNRTHHRLFSGVEDAGFEIRDTITWHYGSGFPKASDMSKTIDKRADAEREVVGEKTAPDGVPLADRVSHSGEEYDEESADYADCKRDVYERAPATDAPKKWDGWKTGLKPATEYVVMARKPYDGATVDSVLENGTGALNIDACRVGTSGDGYHDREESHNPDADTGVALEGSVSGELNEQTQSEPHTEGRYPSNVVFDEVEAERLDREVGPRESDGIDFSETTDNQNRDKYGEYSGERTKSYVYDDNHDGPSRYFYTSKASKAERTLDGRIDNAHPTVKPADLMEWLVTLVTADG